MCGLYGVIRFDGITDRDREIFDGLALNLLHRGPDGTGRIETPQVLLGMHRLSIMDVDHGWQPFWSEDRQIGALGNGEIYNSSTLRALVRDLGHQLHTSSDIEVVPHLFEDFGTETFSKLRGMFALVILDKERHRLILARDRLGEKPLCYATIDGGLVFSSEQSALVRSGAIPFVIDQQLLPEYLLHGFTPEPLSLISGVRKIPAGAWLDINLRSGTVLEQHYWSLLDSLDDRPLSTSDLSAAIQDAVEASCQSDVQVGLALSGGLDSSLVAYMASRIRPDLHAFSIGYNGAKSDESEMATSLASDLNIPCTVLHLDAHEVGASFSEICVARDEPISDIAGPALSAVSRAARTAGVPVLMTGIGGDEWFWGYEWVRRLGAYTYGRTLSHGDVAAKFRLKQQLPDRSLAGIGRWFDSRAGLRTERDVDSFIRMWETPEEIPISLYEFQYGYPRVHAAISALCGIDRGVPKPHRFVSRDASQVAAEYIHALCDTYLKVNSLGQMDRLSMHHSVEARTPLADYKLAELVMSNKLAGDGSLCQPGKTELRKVAYSILPRAVVNRPKRGFTPPVRDWLKAIWQENAQALGPDSALAASQLFNPDLVQTMMKTPTFHTGRVNQIALRLGTLELWYRAF